MRKSLIVVQDGGHYMIEHGDTVILSRWEGDPSWTNPGEVVAEFGEDDLGLKVHVEGFELLIICSLMKEYLDKQPESNYFDSYTWFNLAED